MAKSADKNSLANRVRRQVRADLGRPVVKPGTTSVKRPELKASSSPSRTQFEPHNKVATRTPKVDRGAYDKNYTSGKPRRMK